jgi:hypothetical protein
MAMKFEGMWQSANMHRSMKIWNWSPAGVLMGGKAMASFSLS